MKAEIITIGDEILIGQIVDTNAAYIAQKLNSAGFVVSERSSVGDRAEQIVRAIEVVARIHARSKGTYPIIGVGGLMTPEDIKAMLNAGATLVQLYTGVIYEGMSLVRRTCKMMIAEAQGNDAELPANNTEQ